LLHHAVLQSIFNITYIHLWVKPENVVISRSTTLKELSLLKPLCVSLTFSIVFFLEYSTSVFCFLYSTLMANKKVKLCDRARQVSKQNKIELEIDFNMVSA